MTNPTDVDEKKLDGPWVIVKSSRVYGMFIDPFPDRDSPRAIICHACAHKLCDDNPWIEQLLNPHDSHAHHTKNIPALLEQEHRGWDLDRHYDGSHS